MALALLDAVLAFCQYRRWSVRYWLALPVRLCINNSPLSRRQADPIAAKGELTHRMVGVSLTYAGCRAGISSLSWLVPVRGRTWEALTG